MSEVISPKGAIRNMQDLRLCVVVVRADSCTASVPGGNCVCAESYPMRNLLDYTLKPEDMKGEELFAHKCKIRNRAATSADVSVRRI
jgi:hypothetical protein